MSGTDIDTGLGCSSITYISSTFFFCQGKGCFSYDDHHHVSSVDFALCIFFCAARVTSHLRPVPAEKKKKASFRKGKVEISPSVYGFRKRCGGPYLRGM